VLEGLLALVSPADQCCETALAAVARLPLLESLDLASDAVKDVHIRALADGKCPPRSLTALRLSSRRLTSACFHALAGLSLLRSLEIGGHVRKVYAQTLEPLYDMKKLRHLEVSPALHSLNHLSAPSQHGGTSSLCCVGLRSSSLSPLRLRFSFSDQAAAWG
jgi:hypothetical protein